MRQAFRRSEDMVAAWSPDPQDRARYAFADYVQGVRFLAAYGEAKFLATGHGPVLVGGVAGFQDAQVRAGAGA